MNSILRISIPVFILMVMGSLTAFAPVDNKVQLRLNLQKGDTFKLEALTTQDIRQNIVGQQQDIKQSIGLGYTFEVAESNGNLHTLDVSYHHISFSQEGPLGIIQYDSEESNGEIDPQALGYAALSNQRFQVKINSLGNVEDVIGVDQMVDNMSKYFMHIDPENHEALKESLHNQFGDESIRANIESLMAIYPKEKVQVGDRWTKEILVNQGIPVKMANTYQITDRTSGIATLELTSTVHPNTDKPFLMGDVLMTYDMKGVQSGTSTLNETTGRVIQSKTRQELSGQITMITDEVPDGVSWPITLNSVNTVVTVK